MIELFLDVEHTEIKMREIPASAPLTEAFPAVYKLQGGIWRPASALVVTKVS